ncbi:hypothetical protein ACQJBY_052662 [Aegilops geniculata]
MSKLTHLRQVIALCFFFNALQTRGVRLHPVVLEWKRNDSISYDFVRATQNLESLKPNSTEAITFGKDSSSWDEPYFAVHQTSYGGPNDNYYGLHATMDVYGHKLKPGQWSTTAIWVSHHGDGATSSFNSIQAGWHIYPERYGDSRPHFYTQWTRDGHGATGCFNMDCPGFVRANGAAISPGDAIQPVSDVPHGHIQSITLRVLKVFSIREGENHLQIEKSTLFVFQLLVKSTFGPSTSKPDNLHPPTIETRQGCLGQP